MLPDRAGDRLLGVFGPEISLDWRAGYGDGRTSEGMGGGVACPSRWKRTRTMDGRGDAAVLVVVRVVLVAGGSVCWCVGVGGASLVMLSETGGSTTGGHEENMHLHLLAFASWSGRSV